jgi:type IV conjugative transfer system protein TraE
MQEEHWVLLPQQRLEQPLSLTRSTFSEAYLIQWAESLTRELYTVNPLTAEHNATEFLRLAASRYGGLKDRIQSSAKKIKEEGISTAFYPKSFDVSQSTQTILVTGEYLAFFGRDKTPVTQEKTFKLQWEKSPNGIILLCDW